MKRVLVLAAIAMQTMPLAACHAPASEEPIGVDQRVAHELSRAEDDEVSPRLLRRFQPLATPSTGASIAFGWTRWDAYLEGDDAALDGEEKLGLRTFIEAGCIACHSGELPALRNAAATDPSLHDGSASALERALERTPLPHAGATPSREEHRAIATWLGSLTGPLPARAPAGH